MKQIFVILFLASALLWSCRSSRHGKGSSRSMDTVTVSAFSNPMSIYRATTPQLWKINHTRVALSFDFSARTASGQAWLSLQPYFYPTDTLRLDAKGMKIESVTIGQNDKPLSFTYDSLQLRIRLDRVYRKEEIVRLSVKYVAMPYAEASGGSEAITDDRGLYFINTDKRKEGKPVQIWTQGETESNSHWLPTIDKPNMRTTVQLELTVPGQYKTLSNGALVSSMDHGTNRTDIWRMDQPIQVYAIMFAIGEFAIAKDKWKDKEVNYYVEPAYAPYARTMFQYTPEMIGFFSDITGVPYPWNKYSQVVVRDYVSGAMENTSASLFGEFMNQDNMEYRDGNHEDVVSHELFHQWFGDYVTAESWSHLTINESFATYGEYLWRRYKYGKPYADQLAWEDLQRYINYADYNGDPMLVRHYYRDKEQMFDRISYQKGGAILHYLHHLAGDSAFYRSMNIYLTRNALQAAEATNWRLAVEEATGKDWNDFFNQWYYRAGHPVLNVQYRYDDAAGKLEVTVQQAQQESVGLYTLPLTTMVIYGNEYEEIDWTISKAKETFSIAYKNGVQPVVVPDVAHVLPGTISEHKQYKHWLIQLDRCEDYISQYQAVNSIQVKDLPQADVQLILHHALDKKTAAIRQAALEKIRDIGNDWLRDKWAPDVAHLAGTDGNTSVRAIALEVLGAWKRKEYRDLLMQSVKDSSYYVAGNAVYALYQLNDSLGYAIARQNLGHRPNTNIDIKAWSVIAEKGNEADTSLFARYDGMKADDQDRRHLTVDLATYLVQVNSVAAFDFGIRRLSRRVAETENKNSRTYYALLFRGIHEHIKSVLAKEKRNPTAASKLQLLKKEVAALREREKEKDVLKVYNDILR